MEFDEAALTKFLEAQIAQDAWLETDDNRVIEAYKDVLRAALSHEITIPDLLQHHIDGLDDPNAPYTDILKFDTTTDAGRDYFDALNPFYCLCLMTKSITESDPPGYNSPHLIEDRDKLIVSLLENKRLDDTEKQKYINMVNEVLTEYVDPFELPPTEENPALREALLEGYVAVKAEEAFLADVRGALRNMIRRSILETLTQTFGEHDDIGSLSSLISLNAQIIVENYDPTDLEEYEDVLRATSGIPTSFAVPSGVDEDLIYALTREASQILIESGLF